MHVNFIHRLTYSNHSIIEPNVHLNASIFISAQDGFPLPIY